MPTSYQLSAFGINAMEYAEEGGAVFPCTRRDKTPLTKNGFRDATTDPEKVRQWWTANPDANIGIPTGLANGIVVVDVDGPEGQNSLVAIEAKYGELPKTRACRTGRGVHLYFQHPGREVTIKSSVGKLGRGLDVRADGAYVIAPPSVHQSGAVYQWADATIDPAPLPSWLLNLLADCSKSNPSSIGAEVTAIPKGERNSTLTSIAGTMRARGLDRAAIEAAILSHNESHCDPPLSESEVKRIAASVATYQPGVIPSKPELSADWSEPQSLPDDLPPVKPFDVAILPTSFAPWIADIAERMQCPPDYPAVAAMVAAGSLIGRKVGIRPKLRDDWLEVANLWGMAVGRPGVMKTPAMQEPLKPLTRMEFDASRAHAEAMTEYEAKQIIATERRKVDGLRVRKALKDGGDAAGIATAIVKQEGTEPVRLRFMTNDCTVEKLGAVLADNPNGVLVSRDELSAFLRTMDREGHEADRGFYLEAWNGKGRFTYDRIGRGTLDIEAAIVSILGSIQPGPLQEYLRGAVGGGMGDDGLMQRFQLAVWPDVSGQWKNVDEWPNKAARDGAYEVFKRLNALCPESVRAERDPFTPNGVPFLHFDEESQPIFNTWRERLEARVRGTSEHPAMEAHLSKYRKLIPALSLIIHLAEGSVGSVGASPVQKAIAWGDYLETHARRIYAGVTRAAHLSARALAGRIDAREVADGFALRDVYRNGWSLLANRDDALSATDVLMGLGWLREEMTETGGRDKTRFRINPRLIPQNLEHLPDDTDKTDKRPDGTPSVGSGSSLA